VEEGERRSPTVICDHRDVAFKLDLHVWGVSRGGMSAVPRSSGVACRTGRVSFALAPLDQGRDVVTAANALSQPRHKQ